MEFFMKKFWVFIGFVVVLEIIIIHGQNTTAPPQWGEWENCTVYRTRYRECNATVTNCTGTNTDNDTLAYDTCPILSSEDIAIVQTKRENDKIEKLAEIENNTQATIEAIQQTYKVSIATSKGFGYIAAIFICVLFSLPFMCDIHKVAVYQCEKKKIHSEGLKPKLEPPKPKGPPKQGSKPVVQLSPAQYIDNSEA